MKEARNGPFFKKKFKQNKFYLIFQVSLAASLRCNIENGVQKKDPFEVDRRPQHRGPRPYRTRRRGRVVQQRKALQGNNRMTQDVITIIVHFRLKIDQKTKCQKWLLCMENNYNFANKTGLA